MPVNQEIASGVICADAVYHVDEIKRRLGIGEWALRQMRRRGLKVRRCGRRSFVLGRDLIDEIERNGRVVE